MAMSDKEIRHNLTIVSDTLNFAKGHHSIHVMKYDIERALKRIQAVIVELEERRK